MTDTRPGDEWTLICPPGRMAEAEVIADCARENIREIAESPLAQDHFIMVNDSWRERFFKEVMDRPLEFRPSYRMPPVPMISDPMALIRVTGA